MDLLSTEGQMSRLVVNHAAGHDTHLHTVMLQPDTEGSMLKSITTSPETLAHQYGCAPGALDLCGFNGIKIHGATTTHMGPVGITFSSMCPKTKEFVPLQTLTRSCFQHQVHSEGEMHDAGQLCHYIANPSSVGFVQPPVDIKLHESQCPDNMATNLCLRQMRWPDLKMTPTEPYPVVQSEAHGEMTAVPMQAPAQCNVSHLLMTNEANFAEIAGKTAKIVETTSGKFAMVPKDTMSRIQDKLTASFETKSLFNGGLTCTMFPLTGKPMSKDCVTTLTYSLMKDPKPLRERAAGVHESPETSFIEQVREHNIGYLLGEGGETHAAMSPAATPTELTAELSALVNAK